MPLSLPIVCPYVGSADFSTILIKLRTPKMISQVIESVESVCQPLFIITPYQLNSRDTMLVIIEKEYAARVRENLEKCPNVSEASILEGIPVETFFPLMIGGMRGVIFSWKTLRAIFADAYNHLQPAIVKTMLFHIGFMGGKGIAQHLLMENPGRDPHKLIQQYLTSCFPAWGDGLPQELTRKGDTYLLIIKDLIECKTQAQLNLRHGSHFYRGLFAGLLTGALGKEYTAIEKACLTRGDLYCAFILTPKTKTPRPENQIRQPLQATH